MMSSRARLRVDVSFIVKVTHFKVEARGFVVSKFSVSTLYFAMHDIRTETNILSMYTTTKFDCYQAFTFSMACPLTDISLETTKARFTSLSHKLVMNLCN